MKYHLILENAAGEQLDMSTTANRYMMSKVTGLDPPGATISTATYATMNGSQLNRAFLEKRNIVISFEMRGVGVEKRRHRLYRVAKPSEYIKVYYRTSNIDVYTEGVVETCEPSRFDMPVSGQISILCPDVYFCSTAVSSAVLSFRLLLQKSPVCRWACIGPTTASPYRTTVTPSAWRSRWKPKAAS